MLTETRELKETIIADGIVTARYFTTIFRDGEQVYQVWETETLAPDTDTAALVNQVTAINAKLAVKP